MKKVLILALALSLLTATAFARDALHLFLDIPFGVTVDEFIGMAWQKAGVRLEKQTLQGEDTDAERLYVFMPADEKVILFGERAQITPNFDGRGKLSYVVVGLFNEDGEPWTFPSGETGYASCLENIESFLIALEKEYGPPTSGKLSADGQTKLPYAKGRLTEKPLLEAMNDGRDFTILAQFGNVRATVEFTQMGKECTLSKWVLFSNQMPAL